MIYKLFMKYFVVAFSSFVLDIILFSAILGILDFNSKILAATILARVVSSIYNYIIIIIGREVECAVIGNHLPVASSVGEILSAEEFYSFNSKYKNKESFTVIPASLDSNIIEDIRKQAIKAYLACVSMYPKLMEHYGYNYSELLDELIKLAK